eukprot:118336-Chlamydomonas_euryale.AAC.4
MDVQNVHALAAFRQLQGTWASPKLSSKRKMDACRKFILPVFSCGCETGHERRFRWADKRSLILIVSAGLLA